MLSVLYTLLPKEVARFWRSINTRVGGSVGGIVLELNTVWVSKHRLEGM